MLTVYSTVKKKKRIERITLLWICTAQKKVFFLILLKSSYSKKKKEEDGGKRKKNEETVNGKRPLKKKIPFNHRNKADKNNFLFFFWC